MIAKRKMIVNVIAASLLLGTAVSGAAAMKEGNNAVFKLQNSLRICAMPVTG